MPEQIHGPGSPSTTARPPVMYSNANPLMFARLAMCDRSSRTGALSSPPMMTSAPERRMPARASASPWMMNSPWAAPYARPLPTDPPRHSPSAQRPFSTTTLPPNAALATPSCAPPSATTRHALRCGTRRTPRQRRPRATMRHPPRRAGCWRCSPRERRVPERPRNRANGRPPGIATAVHDTIRARRRTHGRHVLDDVTVAPPRTSGTGR